MAAAKANNGPAIPGAPATGFGSEAASWNDRNATTRS